MTEPEQIELLERDLRKVIQLYKDEYQLSVAAAVGTLEIIKLELWREQTEKLEDEL